MKHTPKFLRQRRFMMILPVLTLPFLSVIFWTLGGGQQVAATPSAVAPAGINANLPEAQFDERRPWDKFSAYEEAARQQTEIERARESDPYFELISSESTIFKPDSNALIETFPNRQPLGQDPLEVKVNQKLDELYKELSKPAEPSVRAAERLPISIDNATSFTSDVDRLEQMMELMMEDHQEDPEMQQIESLLEKILDVQHPERVKQRLQQQTEKNTINTLSVQPANLHTPDDDFISASKPVTSVGFFGLEEPASTTQQIPSAMTAVIHDTQELVSGATVKLRLTEEVWIDQIRIPKDQLIYGIGSIQDERLTITINSIRTGNTVLPVKLQVYDLDGLEGIYVPGAITRDAAKQASENALQNMQLMTLDPSLAAQATTAGIEATKGLLSKKAKLLKVTIRAGYRVLLVNQTPESENELFH